MTNEELANEIDRRLAECTAKKIFPNVKLLGWENIKMAIDALRANAAPQGVGCLMEVGEIVVLDDDTATRLCQWDNDARDRLPTGAKIYAMSSPAAGHAEGGAERSLHPATAKLVADFSSALAEKLSAAEQKYGYSDGWMSKDWMDECRQKLREHVEKGDPRDAAAYCAFLWYHGESTASPDSVVVPREPVAWMHPIDSYYVTCAANKKKWPGTYSEFTIPLYPPLKGDKHG